MPDELALIEPINAVLERERTPGAHSRHHFNAAGAALPTATTVEAVVRHLHDELAQGGYEAAISNKPLVEKAYENAAGLIDATPEQIAFFDSATTAMRQVLDALRIPQERA